MFNAFMEQERKQMQEREKEDTARDAVYGMITQFILDDPTIPENRKIGLRIADAGRALEDAIHEMIMKIADPCAPGGDRYEELYQLRKELLEYLQLMRVGVKAFADSHPVPEVR